jgi:hypothetical protein
VSFSIASTLSSVPSAPDISFRAPLPPRPVERFDLAHPLVPRALEGLSILHIADLHVRRDLLHTDRYRDILHALDRTPADLIAITGDLMDEPGHERPALRTLLALAQRWRPRLGVCGVFGNHDTPEFQRACRRELPGIHWIGGRALDLPVNGATLRLLGLDWPEDPLALMLNNAPSPSMPRCLNASMPLFTLALAHHPTALIPAAEFNIPILLAGHTHAGQVRLHPRLAPHTSSDLPMHLASGLLGLRSTICGISRGLGDGVVEHLRINCPRQMPLYTLRRAPQVSGPQAVTQILSW